MLQTWFQNRRSKEKIKREKAAAAALNQPSNPISSDGAPNISSNQRTISSNSELETSVLRASTAIQVEVECSAMLSPSEQTSVSQPDQMDVTSGVAPSSPSMSSTGEGSSGYGSLKEPMKDFNMNARNGIYATSYPIIKPEANFSEEPVFEGGVSKSAPNEVPNTFYCPPSVDGTPNVTLINSNSSQPPPQPPPPAKTYMAATVQSDSSPSVLKSFATSRQDCTPHSVTNNVLFTPSITRQSGSAVQAMALTAAPTPSQSKPSIALPIHLVPTTATPTGLSL